MSSKVEYVSIQLPKYQIQFLDDKLKLQYYTNQNNKLKSTDYKSKYFKLIYATFSIAKDRICHDITHHDEQK